MKQSVPALKLSALSLLLMLSGSRVFSFTPSTITRADLYTYANGQTADIRIDASGNSDEIQGGDTLTFAVGSVINIIPQNLPADNRNYRKDTEYRIVAANYTLIDNSTLTVQGASFLTFSKSIRDYSYLYLTITYNSLENQTDSYSLEKDAVNALGTLFTQRLDTLSEAAELTGNAPGVSTDTDQDSESTGGQTFSPSKNTHSYLKNQRIRMSFNARNSKRPLSQALRLLESTGPVSKKVGNFSFWVGALYGCGKSKATETSSGVSDYNEGLAIGAEYAIPTFNQHFGVGVSRGWGWSYARAYRDNSSKHHYYQVGAYHSIMPIKNLRIDNSVVYTSVFSSNQRIAQASSSSYLLAHSKTALRSVIVGPEVSYKAKIKEGMSVKPYYGLTYKHLRRDGYQEYEAGSYNHRYEQKDQDVLDHYVGFTFRQKKKTSEMMLSYMIGLTYTKTIHQSKGEEAFSVPGFGSQRYTVSPQDYGKSILSPSLTLTAHSLDKRQSFSLSYTANVQRYRLSHEVLAKFLYIL